MLLVANPFEGFCIGIGSVFLAVFIGIALGNASSRRK